MDLKSKCGLFFQIFGRCPTVKKKVCFPTLQFFCVALGLIVFCHGLLLSCKFTIFALQIEAVYASNFRPIENIKTQYYADIRKTIRFGETDTDGN